MAKSKETFNKREKEKQRIKQKQEKREKMEERKAINKKSSSLSDMMAYIDENGNLTDTPPDPRKKKEFLQEEMIIGVPKQTEPEPGELIRHGYVDFFNSTKGFGFIKDKQTGESFFFHESELQQALKEGDRLTFESERGPKGPVAVRIQKEV
ncbi:MAG: DNA-binding protein [Chitinophagaceae bacterium]